MNKLNITIENTKCGLGDMLHRIDTIYKFCKKFNHNFYMPDISSNLHDNNYDEILGITNYTTHKNNWKGEIKKINMKELSSVSALNDSGVLLSVLYDHEFARTFQVDLKLNEQPRLDYTPFVKLLQEPIEKDTDILLHLRMGDSYIYKISKDVFFHSRIRKIVNINDLSATDLENQWETEDVSKIIKYCEAKNLTYKIHCDGAQSAHRYMKWTKDEDKISLKEEILASIDNYEKEFLNLASGNPNIVYGSSDINAAISDILKTKLIIYTVGGFAIGINKFLNPQPTKSVHIKRYLNEIK